MALQQKATNAKKPQPSSELPWWLYAIIAGVGVVAGLLTATGVLDFSPKPGVQRASLAIFRGLHEIAGPAGPTTAFGLVALIFGWISFKSYRSQA